MKKIITILLLCVLLTACAVNQNVENTENGEPPIETFFLADHPWVSVNEEPLAYEWLIPRMRIWNENTVTIWLYGRIDGELVQTGDYDFTITNIVLESEGFREYPEDEQWLNYNPETGILRYTRFNEFSEEYMHIYFERVIIQCSEECY